MRRHSEPRIPRHAISIIIIILVVVSRLMAFLLFFIRSPLQTPLPEQEMVATDGMDVDVETLGTKELAYHITQLDWELFWGVHEYELLYHTFGRHHFGKVEKW